MLGIMLLGSFVFLASYFVWLYFVSPKSDIQRIEADLGGTDMKVLKAERVGTKHARAVFTFVAGNPTYANGGGWYRLYEVTAEKPDGEQESYSVAVGANLVGFRDLQRIDPRAGR